MTPLASFFERHPKKRKVDLARHAGVTPGRITQLCADPTAKPSLKLAVAIQEWTDNRVRPEDWGTSQEEAA